MAYDIRQLIVNQSTVIVRSETSQLLDNPSPIRNRLRKTLATGPNRPIIGQQIVKIVRRSTEAA